MRCWPESHTQECWRRVHAGPGLAGDLSLGSAELVTFLSVVKKQDKKQLKGEIAYFPS